MLKQEEIIKLLQLSPHDEGGYYRQVFEEDLQIACEERKGILRAAINTIYYFLTHESPIGLIHKNQSSIVHFFHLGDSVEYLLVSPTGELSKKVLGPALDRGQELQFTTPANYWKCTRLLSGQYALLSEAVAPGFDYRDREIGEVKLIQALFPQHWHVLQQHTK